MKRTIGILAAVVLGFSAIAFASGQGDVPNEEMKNPDACQNGSAKGGEKKGENPAPPISSAEEEAKDDCEEKETDPKGGNCVTMNQSEERYIVAEFSSDPKSSGCSSCVGHNGVQGRRPHLALHRIFGTANTPVISSYGPWMANSYDYWVRFTASNLTFYDPVSGLRDSFYWQNNRWNPSAGYWPGMSTITSFGGGHVIVRHRDGRVLDFEITEYRQGGTYQVARLVSISYPEGVAYTLTYQVPSSDTTPDVVKRNTISDSYGKSMSFAYTTFKNMPAVSSVTLPQRQDGQGQSIIYSYDLAVSVWTPKEIDYGNGMVSQFNFQDNWYWTFNHVKDVMLPADRNELYMAFNGMAGRVRRQKRADGTEFLQRTALSSTDPDGVTVITTTTWDRGKKSEYVATTDGSLRRSRYMKEDGTWTDYRYYTVSAHKGVTSHTELLADGGQRTWSVTRNASTDVVTSRTYPDGMRKTFTYNQYNQKTSEHVIADGKDIAELWEYDEQGKGLLLSHTVGVTTPPNPDQATEYWTYNDDGQVLTHTDFNGNVTTNTYNAQGLLESVTLPAGEGQPAQTTTYSYYDDGKVKRVTGMTGLPGEHYVEYTYEPVTGRLTNVSYNGMSNESTVYRQDKPWQVDKNIDRNGNETRYTYDAYGRVTKTEIWGPQAASASHVTETEYFNNINDRVKSVTVNGDKTQYTYDYLGRVLTTTRFVDATNTLVTLNQYDRYNLIATRDPYGRWTRYTYDIMDRLLATTTGLTPGSIPSGPGGGVGLATITVSPPSQDVPITGTRQFTAVGKDQYGNVIQPQPAFTWSVSGGGTISSTGLFTAGWTVGGPYTVTATYGAVQGTAEVTVVASSVIAYEGFDYGGSDGNLHGLGGDGDGFAAANKWSRHYGTNADYRAAGLTFGGLQVTGGCAYLRGAGSNTVATRRLSQSLSGTVWGSYLFKTAADVTGNWSAVGLAKGANAVWTGDYEFLTSYSNGSVPAVGMKGLVNGTDAGSFDNSTKMVLFKMTDVGAAGSSSITAWLLTEAQLAYWKSAGLETLTSSTPVGTASTQVWGRASAAGGTTDLATAFVSLRIFVTPAYIDEFRLGVTAADVTPMSGGTPTLTTIAVAPSNGSVVTNGTIQFAAVGKDQFGQPLSPQPTFDWTITGGGTIDENGLFTAGDTAGGPHTVTATVGSINGTANVTITEPTPPVLTTIVVTPAEANVTLGGTQQFAAVAKDQYGQNISPQPTFTWSVNGGGTIDSTGLFTANTLGGGPYIVTAASGSVNGTAIINFPTTNQLIVTRTEYNQDGSVKATIDPRGIRTNYTYDNRDRTVSTTVAVGTDVEATISVTYDANSNVLTSTDERGKVWTTTYTARNQVLTSSDPLGNTTTYAYTPDGLVATVTNPNGHTTTNTYGLCCRRLVKVTDHDGNFKEFAYDDNGNLTEAIDENGRKVAYEYDALNRQIKQIIDPDGAQPPPAVALNLTTETIYQTGQELMAPGSVVITKGPVLTDDSRQIVRTTTDGAGRTILIQELDAQDTALATTAYSYADTVDADGLVRTTVVTDPGEGKLNLTSISATDGAGRTIKTIDGLGKVTVMEYDPNGNVLSVTDRDGKITRSTYDPRNRTVTTVQNAATQPEDDPVDVVTTYEYDEAGNLLKITDAEGKQTQYEFDNAGRRTKTIYAANSSTQPDQPGPGPRVYDYTYHPAGQLASVIKPNGVRIEYAYENRDLLATRTYATSQPDGWQPLGEDTFTYHANGLLATAHGGLYNTNVNRDAENLADYDAANRLLSELQNIGAGAKTFTYTYTNDNLPDTVTYPSGAQVQQTYTNRRQLYAVNLAAPGEQQLTPQAWHEYDTAGRLTMRHRANNTETLWTYDANSRVTGINHQAAQGGAIFQAWTYAYSDEGNPLAQKDTTPNLAAWGEAYRYDRMNRLIDAKRGPVDANNNVPVLDILLRQQWDLTKVGNWEQWTKSQQGEQDVIETREHNDLHSLTSRTIDQEPAKDLVYDANGNQIDDGEQFLFEYDANDQLKTVRNRATNAVVVEYRYDVFGRRIEKDVKAGNPKGAPVGITRCYYTDQRIAEERDGNDVVQACYTYGHYIDEPLTMDRWNGESFTRHFYHQNRMFSTYVLTDAQGAVVERYAYTAYGECKTYMVDYTGEQSISRVGASFAFTGRELDLETGLIHYRARTYNPVTGRMNQTDPAEFADGLNLYQYVRSSPYVGRDPTGLKCKECPEGQIAVSNGKPVTVNGCGGGSTAGVVPDKIAGVDFTNACNQHDRCYGDCGKTKAYCDDELVSDMQVQCLFKFGWWSLMPSPAIYKAEYAACAKIADLYGAAVRKLGEKAHTQAQESYCKCICPPKESSPPATQPATGGPTSQPEGQPATPPPPPPPSPPAQKKYTPTPNDLFRRLFPPNSPFDRVIL